jgi:hypothetical protein
MHADHSPGVFVLISQLDCQLTGFFAGPNVNHTNFLLCTRSKYFCSVSVKLYEIEMRVGV